MIRCETIKLKDICDKISYGYTASAVPESTGIKYLRITDIVNTFIDWGSVPFCKVSDIDYEKYKVENGDILIARTGATVGYAKQIKSKYEKSVFASYLIRIKINSKADRYFIGLLITSDTYKNYIKTIAGGAAQPNANAKDLTSFKFYLPPLPIQKKIAAVLSAYDDLIENNKRRIAVLEKMAEEIYHAWFVRMRFPGHEKVNFNKGVPAGWEIKKLDDIAEITSSKRIYVQDYVQSGIPFYRSKEIIEKYNYSDISTPLFIREKKYNEIKIKFGAPEYGDLLITSVGTLGIPYIVKKNDQFYFKDGNLIWFRKMGIIYSIYLYHWIQSESGKNSLLQTTIGTSQQAFTIENLKKINILKPSENILKLFYNLIDPIYKNMENLSISNRLLKQSRDFLLPRLISGKLSVEDLDIQFPPSMEEEDA